MKTIASALNKSCIEYHYEAKKYSHDVELFLFKEANDKIYAKTRLALTHLRHVKVQLSLQTRLAKYRDGEKIVLEPYFNSQTHSIVSGLYVQTTINKCFAQILRFYDSFLTEGSGWWLEKILLIKLHIAKYRPLRGGGLLQRSTLPRQIKSKKAVLDIKCNDGKCFLYCILAHMFPVKENPQRISNYNDKISLLRIDDISFPMRIKNIAKFEEMNSLSINVYGFEKAPFPMYVSKFDLADSRKEIDLLFYNNHFYLIRSLSRLIGTCFTKASYASFICRKCLCAFPTLQKLDVHRETCTSDLQRYLLPQKGSVKKFTKFRTQFMNAFVIYYDIEAIQTEKHGISKRVGDKKHYAIAISAKRVCTVKKYDGELFCYTGLDAIERFFNYLECQILEIQCIYHAYYKPVKMTQKDLEHHHSQTFCSLCKYVFSHHKEKRIDHCHLTGEYRGCLCNRCNLTYASATRKLVCIAHGGLNYDIKLILSTFANSKRKRNLRVIAKNKEKFLCVYIDSFIFIDSFSFLQASLQTLAESLCSKGEDSFTYTRQIAKSTQQFKLLLRKGVFCYDFLDSMSKLKLTSLPCKQHFYDKLREKSISSNDYLHAKRVWYTFECNSLQDYMEIYLKTDVLLLADVFESFRAMCFEFYGLDCSYFVSLPQYGMEALLKRSGVELELFTDIDMINFIYRGVRGGQSMITKRHAEANNPYMKNYDSNKETSYLIYLDCTNLYGLALTQYLPLKNFRFLDEEEIGALDIKSVPKNNERGYILEVDLAYPAYLHNKHNDFPLAPEKRKISPAQWSVWLRTAAHVYNLKEKSGVEKLMSTFYEKKRYVVHYVVLQLYLKLGMQLKRVHRILAFTQSPWIKDFIDFNTAQRKSARSKFEQDLFKLLSNSVFGKLLEDAKKRIDFRLVTKKKRFLSLTRKPTFKECTIINRGLVGVHMKRASVLLDKQIAVGFSVLDLAKCHLYKFHHNFMKPMYNENIELCFTDTDSLLYHVKTFDLYDDIKYNLKYFDTSNFPKDHVLFSEERKKKLGTFKDEMGGEIVTNFVGLKAKVYAILTEKDKNVKKAKGLKSHITQSLSFDEYKSALHLGAIRKHEFYSIRSLQNNLYTTKRSIAGLSPVDDKRYILEDGISTLAYGHHKIV